MDAAQLSSLCGCHPAPSSSPQTSHPPEELRWSREREAASPPWTRMRSEVRRSEPQRQVVCGIQSTLELIGCRAAEGDAVWESRGLRTPLARARAP